MVEGQRKYYALSDTCDMSQGEEMSTQMMDGKRCIFIGEGAGVGRNGSDGQFGQGFCEIRPGMDDLWQVHQLGP